jgi:hypothetical protein
VACQPTALSRTYGQVVIIGINLRILVKRFLKRDERDHGKGLNLLSHILNQQGGSAKGAALVAADDAKYGRRGHVTDT